MVYYPIVLTSTVIAAIARYRRGRGRDSKSNRRSSWPPSPSDVEDDNDRPSRRRSHRSRHSTRTEIIPYDPINEDELASYARKTCPLPSPITPPPMRSASRRQEERHHRDTQRSSQYNPYETQLVRYNAQKNEHKLAEDEDPWSEGSDSSDIGYEARRRRTRSEAYSTDTPTAVMTTPPYNPKNEIVRRSSAAVRYTPPYARQYHPQPANPQPANSSAARPGHLRHGSAPMIETRQKRPSRQERPSFNPISYAQAYPPPPPPPFNAQRVGHNTPPTPPTAVPPPPALPYGHGGNRPLRPTLSSRRESQKVLRPEI